MDKIKVALSALWYPLAMAGYFWRALERRKDVELYVTGPYFDDWIPWNGGMRLPRQYVKIPHFPLPPAAAQASGKLPSAVASPPWEPDLWLQIDAGWHFADRPKARVVGHVQTDPHVLKGHYQHPKQYSDHVWCMQDCYRTSDEHFLPYAYDPEFHFPLDNIKKEYDACLIGLHYSQRDAWVNRLRSKGIGVYYSIGEIYDQYQSRYCASKVALSWSSQNDLPARVWEGMAMGLPVVTNRVSDLKTCGFVEGMHYLGFDTLEEAEAQVIRLLVDDDLRSQIAWMAHTTVKEHTWDARIEQIFREAGL